MRKLKKKNYKKENKYLRENLYFLYKLLDDIDTTGDMYKDIDTNSRIKHIDRIHKLRHRLDSSLVDELYDEFYKLDEDILTPVFYDYIEGSNKSRAESQKNAKLRRKEDTKSVINNINNKISRDASLGYTSSKYILASSESDFCDIKLVKRAFENLGYNITYVKPSFNSFITEDYGTFIIHR